MRAIFVLRAAAAVLFSFVSTAMLSGQVENISFRTYSTEHGLSHSTVTSIAQDSGGFIWLGTEDGLNRFDGYAFTIYTHDAKDSGSISGSQVTALLCDRGGTLWIGTSAGLNRFDRAAEKFARVDIAGGDSPGPAPREVSALLLDRRERLWIGTKGNGLVLFDPRTGAGRSYRHDASSPQTIANDSIRSLYLARNGKIWISFYAAGLSIFDTSTGAFNNFSTELPEASEPAQAQITAIGEDREGKLWFASLGDGLFRFDDNLNQLIHYRHDPEDPETYADHTALALASDSRGRFWIGNGETGLDQFIFSENTFRHYPSNGRYPGALSGNRVLSITEDRNGSLWVGTWHGGVSVYHPYRTKFTRLFSRPGDPNSLSENSVRAICEDSHGEVWIGTEASGLDRFDPVSGLMMHYMYQPSNKKSLSHNSVTAIREDRFGNLWIGTAGGGLNRFDRDGNLFVRYSSREGDSTSLASNHVTSLFVDYTGELWIGTAEGDIQRYDRTSDRYVRIQQREPSSILAINEDRVGNVWIGTSSSGMIRHVRSTGASYHMPLRGQISADPQPRVASITVDGSGVVWIATEGSGAAMYVPSRNSFAFVTEEAGLPSDWVSGIVADRKGILWLGTTKGIVRFDQRTNASRVYGTDEGVQGNEFLPGSCILGSGGTIYFGGMNGLNMFRPDSIADNPFPPQLSIASVTAGGNPAPVSSAAGEMEDLHLPSPQSTIAFAYLALEYTAPERNKVMYTLDGFDDGWTTTGGRGTARYTNLREGEYNFRVKGCNNDGTWNEAGIGVRIIVHPQLSERWWVRVLALAGIAGIPLAIYRFSFRRTLNRERSRNKIVRDLHDDVSATLSGIDYYSEVVKNGVKLNDAARVDKYLSLIRESASTAQDSVAEIVWTVNPEEDGWDQLLTQFRRFASGLLEKRSIRHAIDIPRNLPIRPFPIDTRRRFWLLYKEMLVNLVQFSSCKTVAVKIALGDDRRLNLIMAGDGNGVDPSTAEYKDALGQIKKRAEELHCSLEIDHSAEGGTTWKVFFPPA